MPLRTLLLNLTLVPLFLVDTHFKKSKDVDGFTSFELRSKLCLSLAEARYTGCTILYLSYQFSFFLFFDFFFFFLPSRSVTYLLLERLSCGDCSAPAM